MDNLVILILMLFIKVNIVYSCSKQSAPSCEEKNNDSYEERNTFLTNLPSSVKMNRIAMTGTHQSLSYLSGNSKNKTQELDIMFQLKHGIRVFDVTVEAQDDCFAVHSGSMYMRNLFEDMMKIFSKFLEHHPKELTILVMNDDNVTSNRVEGLNCRIINGYIQNSEYFGWRMIKDWSFDDPLGVNRGKILLATVGNAFNGCAVNLGVECKFENFAASSVAEKWLKIVNFQEKCYLEHRNCFVYHLGIQTDKGIRADAKYGGYVVDQHCVEPLNDKMAEFFCPTKFGMYLIMTYYPTQKLIDRINTSNNRTLATMYYWEKVKTKFLYKHKS